MVKNMLIGSVILNITTFNFISFIKYLMIMNGKIAKIININVNIIKVMKLIEVSLLISIFYLV